MENKKMDKDLIQEKLIKYQKKLEQIDRDIRYYAEHLKSSQDEYDLYMESIDLLNEALYNHNDDYEVMKPEQHKNH